VGGGPAEGAYLQLSNESFVGYVNSRHVTFDEDRVSPRMTRLFELAGVGMALHAIRGDGLLVLGHGEADYESSLPAALIQALAGVR